MTFLECVNRMLRLATVMQWDDADITSFTNTQHSGTIALARQAVQHVVNELVGDNFLWPEDATGELTTVAGQRTYSLASDFVRFQDNVPWVMKLEGTTGSDADGQFVTEYIGGENQIQKAIPHYTSDTGNPVWFYFTGDREIGLFQIPDTSSVIYRYLYEKDVMVTSETDSLPFDSDQKAFAFTDMATRIFTFLFTTQPLEGLANDVIYLRSKGALMALLRKKPPSGFYGYRYR